nr:MFS transporter [Rhodococcus sp. 06-621-2]
MSSTSDNTETREAIIEDRAGSSLAITCAAATSVGAPFVLSNAPTPLYLYWQARLGVGSGPMTIVYSAYMVGLICTLMIAGNLADRYARKVVLVPGLLEATAASFLYLIATNTMWLLPARLLTGVAVDAG